MRPLAVVLVLAMIASLGLVLSQPAQGAFRSLSVAAGQYDPLNPTLYVPGETMTITISADNGDMFDVRIWDSTDGTPSANLNNQTVGLTGVKILYWTIPAQWPDTATGATYRVDVYVPTYFENGNVGARYARYTFQIQEYRFSVRTDRDAYLPGDTVTASWSALLIKDGSPAVSGNGTLQFKDAAGNNLLTPDPPGRYNFSASQGSFQFTLATTEPTGTKTAYAWFNDTAGLRIGASTDAFSVRSLGVIVNVGRAVYAPGSLVTVSISAKITNNPGAPSGADPGAANVNVNITVNDLTTGNPVAAYGKSGLLTDAHGDLTYVFQLALSPATGSYEVSVTGTAHSVLTATSSDTFDVEETFAMSVSLTTDKSQYLSGDTVHAKATVFRTTPTSYVFRWTVEDVVAGPDILLVQLAGSDANFSYAVPSNYRGTLRFTVTVNDGQGTTTTDSRTVSVDFGYLALALDRTTYNAGETITATYSLVSSVMTTPTYYYEVRDAGGAVVKSGNATSASFTTPNPASPSYTFAVTASQDGRAVSGSATATEAGGYLLSINLDKPSYLAGETIRVHYTLSARGNSVLPAQFRFQVSLLGGIGTSATTTSPTGDLSLPVPAGTDEGDLLLYVSEANTGAYVYENVHIGPTNPLWTTDVGGIPLFDVLLALVVVVLVIAFLWMWRRGGMGPMGAKPAEKPTPPPPPSGPSQGPPASPMSVVCKHCGKSIEITTSKRPIEVMCPSCGETQLVS